MNATSSLGVVVPANPAPAIPIIAGGSAPAQAGQQAVNAAAAAQAGIPAASSAPLSTAAASVPAQPGALSSLPDSVISWSGYFEALAVLCFVLALLWAVLWLVRKRGGTLLGGSSPTMRIESRLALGPKKWIIVARFLDRRLVLGVTDQQITLLTEMPLEEPSGRDKPAGTRSPFAALLENSVESVRAAEQGPAAMRGQPPASGESPG